MSASKGSAEGNSLVVVESPAKARTIEQYLGDGFTVRASMGHVRDLPQKELGVDLEKHRFRPKYVSIRSKSKVVSELKKLAKDAEAIYLATDPDREGEAIAWHVAVALGGKQANEDPRFRRMTFNEITRSAVTEALAKATGINWNRVEAQQARRVLDRLVGYQVSPILWKALYRGLSAGRVQSVALRLITEREEEIEAFEPREYWTLEATFETDTDAGKVNYHATLDRVRGKKADIGEEAEAREMVADARGMSYRITSIERRKRRRNPPPPFITSTLQQEAARKLGFSAKRTMAVAQQLYEGIDVPGAGSVGLITYMRTDSVRVSAGALAEARELIGREYGSEYLPEKPRHYRGRKGAQDAHEAVRPTSTERPPGKMKGHLDRDQVRLYELIWNRFIASQMNPAELESTTVRTEGGAYAFKSVGSVVTFDGYLALYREGSDNGNGDEAEDGLPAGLVEGADSTLLDLDGEQHFTKPPARFTEASLVKELEQDGIGRPSTYAQIISVLLDRKYVEREGKSLLPTALGRTVCKIVVELFPDIFQVEFTAQMEGELDKIESGQDDYVSVLEDFYEPFARDLEQANDRVSDLKGRLQEPTGEVCEECGRPMVVKWGRRGRFMACSGWPECKNTKPLPEEAEQFQAPEGVRCPDCGAEMVVKSGRYGRFLACTRYPECKGTLPFTVGVNCPECGKPIAEKRSRKGKVFYGCTGYPSCKFATWDPPVDKTCPVCEYPLLVEKTTRTEGHHYRCPECKAVLDPENL